MVNDIIDQRYHPSSWNIYAFQASDGDNWPTDNEELLTSLDTLMPKVQFYGYCEIEPSKERAIWTKDNSLGTLFEGLKYDNLKSSNISVKEDIWGAFKNFFGGEL